ncbi:transporter [Desulfobulbus oligotrophicus]|uniref:Transporter n=1 Tax=Desulfobulbus oligotrophicus TaxID=1909699 RepID=A0A7T5VDF1_9BACT|nr:transporter [Desulfobulbus oligotrophicus]MDY0389511.1 transporter [Desulfobulbus oligotrophicus]QQG65854.1 transporter [Desulfobulbus oligotrophicus]
MSSRPTTTAAVAFACLLGFTLPVQAADAPFEIEHGKINTADASPVDPGAFEFETTFAQTRADRSWSGSGNTHGRGTFRERSLGFSFTAGLIENMDANISGGYSWIKDNDNVYDEDAELLGPFRGEDFTDLELSGRYRFFNDEARHLEIAYIGGVTIPVGSDSDRDEIGTSQEYWSFDQTLVATKDWGQWTLNGDIGFSLPIGNKRENVRGTLNADLALGYQILPWLQPEVELNYSHDYLKDESDAQVLAVTAGFVMPINETWLVNLGVQQDFWGQNVDKTTTWTTTVKIAF